jgi:hypothetical protein
MTPVGFEPTISAGERPQTYALDRADIGTGNQGGYPEGKENTHNCLLIACVSIIKDRIPELYCLMSNGGLRQRLRSVLQKRKESLVRTFQKTDPLNCELFH